MSITDCLTHREEDVLASALHREFEHCVDMRGRIEKHLAAGIVRNFAQSAAMYEKRLAAIDSVLAKLPTWIRESVEA